MISHQSPTALLARVVRGLAAATLVVAVAGCGSSSDSDSFPPLPDVELVDAAGNPASSGDLVGEPLVINFWYSTCVPCAKELAEFAEVDAELGDRVRFVGVNPLDDADTMVSFAGERGVEYELYRDPVAELQIQLEITAFPATVFVGPDGGVVDTTGVLDADELRGEIDELLAVSTSADDEGTGDTESAADVPPGRITAAAITGREVHENDRGRAEPAHEPLLYADPPDLFSDVGS